MFQIPNELKGKILHATTTQNWHTIKEAGFISTTPPSLLNSNPISHSFITSMNGICLFDFRTPNAKKCDTLFSHVPGISSQNETVWLEIEFESIKSDFWSAEQVVDEWRNSSNPHKRCYLHAEGACFSDIPISAIKAVMIYERTQDKFNPFK
ncbi:hypothetical protein [Vibrio salinus]|uniref:hypothetical protein n=1 Tax=Vibrio salinus TaxID=2899784 RepID=UPI001E3BB0D9|nr:hypothetical protein [Vibrio salinus]MCE0493115.1 hypothetical protein [Vibrio salinus]